MPHYKGGEPAKVGDRVRFYHYRECRMVEGIVGAVFPGNTACDATVYCVVLSFPSKTASPDTPACLTLEGNTVTLGECELIPPAS